MGKAVPQRELARNCRLSDPQRGKNVVMVFASYAEKSSGRDAGALSIRSTPDGQLAVFKMCGSSVVTTGFRSLYDTAAFANDDSAVDRSSFWVDRPQIRSGQSDW